MNNFPLKQKLFLRGLGKVEVRTLSKPVVFQHVCRDPFGGQMTFP